MPKFALSRRQFLKVSLRAFAAAALSGLAGYEYVTEIETDWLKVESIQLTLPRLPKAFHGFRLAQISDIHFDDWMTPTRFAKTVDSINALEPDAIAITGDFVLGNQKIQEAGMVKQLSRLRAKQARVAILGNHDHWTDPDFIHHLIARSGITDLTNDLFSLGNSGGFLHLCGVDDYWERQDRLDLVLDKLPKEGCGILLAHEPDYADISGATDRFDLQISGHSHGGQVNIPFIGPPIVPRYAKKYPLGLYQIGTMYQYTNRGIGMIPPRVRFNCRPEITLFTLLSPDT